MRRSLIAWLAGAAIPSAALASDVPVRVYEDVNRSSLSDLSQGVDQKDRPLTGVPVMLVGSETVRETSSDADGRAVFAGVGDGLYLLRPAVEGQVECTSRNLANRLLERLASGSEKVVYVALGDSTPVYGAARPYPARLGDRLRALFPLAETHNLAHEGSTTWDWLPGHWAFEEARAWIGQADLITVSLGGNDLQSLANLDFADFTEALESAQELIAQTLANAALIVAAIRKENPDVDIVWTIYPNYARSKKWLEYVPQAYIGLLQSGMDLAIGMMREGLAENPGLLLADVYEEWADEDIEKFLFDPIHVNDAGAESYARTIFRTLGGVFLPEDHGRERLFGFVMSPATSDPSVPEAVSDETDSPDVSANEDSGEPHGPFPETSDSPGMDESVTGTDAWGMESFTGLERIEDRGPLDSSPVPDGPVSPSGASGGGCRVTEAPAGSLVLLLVVLLVGLRLRPFVRFRSAGRPARTRGP